jgi:beta-aspartyl-peptidase (threonine type)
VPTCILVHGGAGPKAQDEVAERAQGGCLAAAKAGHALLVSGRSALDAVEAAVRVLEDDPQFNAGLGSTLNEEGFAELDASIMDGATLSAGAVAAVRTFQNPVTLARAVMERSPHVLLVGDGAARFGRALGLPEVEPARLVTPRARERWEQRLSVSHGTVGAVALDAEGHVAAATSTGGTFGKLVGRVGDSPLIGCGTYADDTLGAASCTGLGEAIIRATLARHVLDLLGAGASPEAAVQRALASLVRARGDGGLIVVTPKGELAHGFNTERMAWARVDARGLASSGFAPR